MKLFKPFVLFSLFTSAVFSQVIIREKVEIVPHLSTFVAQGGGEVEVALRMSGNVDLVNRKPFVSVWNTYCGLYQSSGGPTVNIPALTGLHNVNAGFSTLGGVNYLIQIKVETDVIMADSGVAPANTTLRFPYQFTLTSGVEVSFSSPIFHGEQTLAIVKNRPFTWCSTPVWHSGMKVTLEIVGRRGLGVLTTGPDVESDSALTVKGTELASVKFIANGRQPLGGEESIVIQARVNGELIGSSTVKVKPTVAVKITNPIADEMIVVSATNQPILTLTEMHLPGPGQPSEPTITWSPSNIIDTKTYYNQIQDTLRLVVTVTAENDKGIASDSRTITLVKEPCNQIIEECSAAQLQPQQFSEANTQTYREGQIFEGKDYLGRGSINVDIQQDACNYLLPPPPTVRFGITLVPQVIPLNATASQLHYASTSDKTIQVCLNKDNGQWHFTVDNLKIPIFISYCPKPEYVDLGDGTDQALLAQVIQNWGIFVKVQDALTKFWIDGSYFHPGTPAPKYVFKGGIMAHEDNHRQVYLESLKKQFSSAFAGIAMLSESIVSSPCPEDAVKKIQPVIDGLLAGALSNVTEEQKEKEKLEAEKKADDAAGSTYKTIYNRIKTWAQNQLWWQQEN